MLTFSKVASLRSSFHNLLTNRFLLPNNGALVPVAGIKSIEERIGVPVKPKRPLVPFMRFYQQIRPELLRENPNIKMGLMARLAAEKWKAADMVVKEKYMLEFRKEQDAFLSEIARYQNNLTDEQREKVKQMKLLMVEKKRIREKRAKAKDMGKPKHPVPAFTKFLTDETNKLADKSTIVFREFAVKAGEKWRNLAPAQRDEYLNNYKKDMLVYRKEIEKWEEKMIKSGNTDLVRRKSLLHTLGGGGGVSVGSEKKTTRKSPNKRE